MELRQDLWEQDRALGGRTMKPVDLHVPGLLLEASWRTDVGQHSKYPPLSSDSESDLLQILFPKWVPSLVAAFRSSRKLNFQSQSLHLARQGLITLPSCIWQLPLGLTLMLVLLLVAKRIFAPNFNWNKSAREIILYRETLFWPTITPPPTPARMLYVSLFQIQSNFWALYPNSALSTVWKVAAWISALQNLL